MPPWPFQGASVQPAFIRAATAQSVWEGLISRQPPAPVRPPAQAPHCRPWWGRAPGSSGGRRRLRLGARVDPAGMDPVIEAARHLVVDLGTEPGQAAETRLDVAAGAAKAVVEIEVAEGGIEVVQPHQADHAPAEPDAFRVAGGTVDGLLGFDEFGGLALVVLDGVGGLVLRGLPWSWGVGVPLWARAPAVPIRKEGMARTAGSDAGRNFELKYPATHTFPDC